jgi:hypothetical protein
VSHINPDDLALIALSPATTTDAQRAHLASCGDCSREERALARTVELGRAGHDAQLMTPPPAVWSRIHAELGLSDSVVQQPVSVTASAAAPTPSQASGPDPAVAPVASPVVAPVVAPVVSLGTRARRRMWPLLVAAVAVGIVGGIVVSAFFVDAAARVSVIAEAALDPLPGQSTSGSARVEEASDGRRDVVVDLAGDSADTAPADGSGREVWLLTEDASGLVSLGFLDGSSGRFAVPDGLDLSAYPVVDVSAETLDGDPAHSGDSLARGPLRARS